MSGSRDSNKVSRDNFYKFLTICLNKIPYFKFFIKKTKIVYTKSRNSLLFWTPSYRFNSSYLWGLKPPSLDFLYSYVVAKPNQISTPIHWISKKSHLNLKSRQRGSINFNNIKIFHPDLARNKLIFLPPRLIFVKSSVK